MPVAKSVRLCPWLHTKLTLNYTYRGLWGTIAVVIVLFVVSAFTERTDPARLEKTTVEWGGSVEPFRGISDWRLHLVVLSVVTIGIYRWLW